MLLSFCPSVLNKTRWASAVMPVYGGWRLHTIDSKTGLLGENKAVADLVTTPVS